MKKMFRTSRFSVAVVVGIVVVSVVRVSVAGELTKWSFESGARTTDSASGGTANTLIETGTMTYTNGVVGDAAVFTNNANYLYAADHSDLDLAYATDWTMECFIKVDTGAPAWRHIAYKWDDPYQINWTLGNNKFDLSVNYNADWVSQVGPELNDNRWHHLAAVNDTSGSSNLLSYVDGVVVNTRAAIVITDTTLSFRLGNGWNGPLGGLMDEFIIHKVAVDQSYINSRMNVLYPCGTVISIK